ncbi:MAG: class I SAM-dependent methyltransferase [Oligoflexales bacterium]|nr:class I SAM-dependent methyltransferase [Oligoflexales bacterium]
MFASVRDFKNRIDYSIRNAICLSRGGYSESGTTLELAVSRYGLNETKLLHELCSRYHFYKYLNKLAETSLLDNLSHLLLLDRISSNFAVEAPAVETILDVGSKNFCYCLAIREFFYRLKASSSGCPAEGENIEITGIEIDPHRMYSNLYCRKAYAEYYMKLCPSAVFLEGDFTTFEFNKKFDLITNFYPFVVSGPLVDWGLPKRFFNPAGMIKRVVELLRADGLYFMTNVSQREFDAADGLLKDRFFPVEKIRVVSELTGIDPVFVSLYKKIG